MFLSFRRHFRALNSRAGTASSEPAFLQTLPGCPSESAKKMQGPRKPPKRSERERERETCQADALNLFLESSEEGSGLADDALAALADSGSGAPSELSLP